MERAKTNALGQQKLSHRDDKAFRSIYITNLMNNDNLGLLGKIEYPDDLRKLRVEQLEEVCSELRHVIVEELAVNP